MMFGTTKNNRKISQMNGGEAENGDGKPTKPKGNGGKGNSADLANRVKKGSMLLVEEWNALSWPEKKGHHPSQEEA